MCEKKVTFENTIREKLCALFLHCVFVTPEYIRGEVAKHFEVPLDSVKVTYEGNSTNEQGEELYRLYKLFLYGIEFILRFEDRIEQPREIEVPKVVNRPKKWYQIKPDSEIIVEKKKTSEKPILHFVLASINV